MHLKLGYHKMGVSTNIYAVYGVKIAYDADFAEAYDEVYDDDDTPTIIVDGMSGDYMVFGTTMYDSGDFRYGMEDGDNWKEIDIGFLTKAEEAYKWIFVNKFPQFAHYMNEPFKLIIFTHYH